MSANRTELVGGPQLTRALRKAGAAGPRLVVGALYREGEAIMTQAKQRTPVLTGALRASGQVRPPDVSGSVVEVTLGFGNSAVGYAIYVHENLMARHPVGEAKYLERPLLEAVRGMEGRLAAAVGRELARAAR